MSYNLISSLSEPVICTTNLTGKMHDQYTHPELKLNMVKQQTQLTFRKHNSIAISKERFHFTDGWILPSLSQCAISD